MAKMKTTRKSIQEAGLTEEVVRAHGVEIVDEIEAPEKAILACALKGTPTPFTDNEEGVCADCGCEVIFRPNAPDGIMKMCLECVMNIAKASVQ